MSYADDVQRKANEEAYWLEKEKLDYQRWLQQATQQARQPYLDQLQALGGDMDWAPAPYESGSPFAAPDRNAVLGDPAYQFMVGQGQRGIRHNASAAGTLQTGGTLKQLSDFGQEAASTQYDRAYQKALDAYTMGETNRQQAYERTNTAGYNRAALINQNRGSQRQTYFNLAQLASPGVYPGFKRPPTAPVVPGGFDDPARPRTPPMGGGGYPGEPYPVGY